MVGRFQSCLSTRTDDLDLLALHGVEYHLYRRFLMLVDDLCTINHYFLSTLDN